MPKYDISNQIKILSIATILLSLLVLTILPISVNAQTQQPDYLTSEILEERISNLVQIEGKNTVDLSDFIIDLANKNNEFAEDFYQKLNYTIAHGDNPPNVNFSNSVIQGNFQLNRLGIFTAVGEGALSSLFTASETSRINQYYPIDNNSPKQIPRINVFRGGLQFKNTVFTGEVEASNSLFLRSLIATSAKFQNLVQFNQVIFDGQVDFSNAIFSQNVNFNLSHFWAKTKFTRAEFQAIANFSNSQFEAVIEFNDTIFQQLADFTHSVFRQTANFSGTMYRDRLIFAKSKFLDSLILIDSSFDKTATFRDIYINATIDLKDVHLLDRLDFSNAFFTPKAQINTSGLAFDSAEAKIIGASGIGQYIKVNRLEGNETVLRNLIRNFRSLEQIADANYIEYHQKQLQAQQLNNAINKNFRQNTLSLITLIPQWLGLNLLLLLGDYGTNINILFALGIITITFFSYLFWIVDRYRPKISQPIVPSCYEIIIMTTTYLVLTIVSIFSILTTTNQPWLTLLSLAIILLPIPILITSKIYLRGRYHKLLDTTYFVENGSLREFRLMLGRLPIMPRFPFFRDRYQPILWTKRWSWLIYYDFSLNNIFKLGFNDIRLRDRHLPGLISALVWYQWCLGVLYIILLLWTLSRTIPGLNLLIYF